MRYLSTGLVRGGKNACNVRGSFKYKNRNRPGPEWSFKNNVGRTWRAWNSGGTESEEERVVAVKSANVSGVRLFLCVSNIHIIWLQPKLTL